MHRQPPPAARRPPRPLQQLQVIDRLRRCPSSTGLRAGLGGRPVVVAVRGRPGRRRLIPGRDRVFLERHSHDLAVRGDLGPGLRFGPGRFGPVRVFRPGRLGVRLGARCARDAARVRRMAKARLPPGPGLRLGERRTAEPGGGPIRSGAGAGRLGFRGGGRRATVITAVLQPRRHGRVVVIAGHGFPQRARIRRAGYACAPDALFAASSDGFSTRNSAANRPVTQSGSDSSGPRPNYRPWPAAKRAAG